MTRLLLLLNGFFLAFSIYMIAASWSAIVIVPILLFGASMVLLATHDSRIGNRILILANSFFATLGILVTLIATVGGIFTYGPGALAVLVLLLPIAVLVANTAHGKRMLVSAH